jgi:hypothetical protein
MMQSSDDASRSFDVPDVVSAIDAARATRRIQEF